MAGAAKYEDKSLYFIFKFILLNIFHSLLFYRWMQVILPLPHHLINMVSLIINIHINKLIYHQWTYITWT